MATSVLLQFAEIAENVWPVDAQGNLNDLSGDASASLSLPEVATTLLGRGRVFGANIGLVATEATIGGTQLIRSCTVRAVLSYAVANANDGNIGTIVARGVQGSDAERILYGLQIERVSATQARLRMRWQEADGTDAVLVGAGFQIPDGDEIYVAATRLWISTSEVLVTYVVNGVKVGEETVEEGDIGNGDGGTFTVGCAGDGLGGYERFLPTDSVLDMVAVEDDPMTLEELAADYDRIFVYQPRGYQILRGNLPKGFTYSRKPDSIVQRWLRAEGDILGYALAKMEELRRNFWPWRAYGAVLARWERVLGLAPKPGDSIATRRTRVHSFLKKAHGFTRANIKLELEDLFNLDSADIDLIEYDATTEDDFAGSALNEQLWTPEEGGGAIAQASGVLTFSNEAAAEVRWNKDHHEAVSIRHPLVAMRGMHAVIKISNYTIAAGGYAGIGFWDYSVAPAKMTFVGLYNDGGTIKLATWSVTGGVEGTPDILATPVTDDPVYLQVAHPGGTIGSEDVAVFNAEVLNANGPWDPDLALNVISSARWVGLILGNRDTPAATGAQTVDFDDFVIFQPHSTRAFNWYAYRDSAESGAYDLQGADLLVQKIKPAHTHAAAIDALNFRLGTDPMGKGPFGSDGS